MHVDLNTSTLAHSAFNSPFLNALEDLIERSTINSTPYTKLHLLNSLLHIATQSLYPPIQEASEDCSSNQLF
ncbi:hypothetical protein AB3G45_19765 [Shinella sp. S4-D37]|uniref:hypothetical protein n=1 Tax=Shinella sp. S4-D37 TaxID=3161999 RepID=UPI00346687AD